MNSSIIKTKNLNLYYGENKAINNCNFSVSTNKVTAIIGPSGCGKSTLLRSMNRMNDFIDYFKLDGEVLLNGKNKAIIFLIEKRSPFIYLYFTPFSFL